MEILNGEIDEIKGWIRSFIDTRTLYNFPNLLTNLVMASKDLKDVNSISDMFCILRCLNWMERTQIKRVIKKLNNSVLLCYLNRITNEGLLLPFVEGDLEHYEYVANMEKEIVDIIVPKAEEMVNRNKITNGPLMECFEYMDIVPVVISNEPIRWLVPGCRIRYEPTNYLYYLIDRNNRKAVVQKINDCLMDVDKDVYEININGDAVYGISVYDKVGGSISEISLEINDMVIETLNKPDSIEDRQTWTFSSFNTISTAIPINAVVCQYSPLKVKFIRTERGNAVDDKAIEIQFMRVHVSEKETRFKLVQSHYSISISGNRTLIIDKEGRKRIINSNQEVEESRKRKAFSDLLRDETTITTSPS